MSSKSNGVEFAPLRSLDDFILESARFQIPNLKDLEKWGKRVSSNLLYYQTNYFLMSVIIFMIFGVIHPIKMVVGTITMIIIFVIFAYVMNEGGALGQFKKKHPVVSAISIFAVVYYLMSSMMGSLLIFLLGILLPFCACFIHASLRLRNIKNKFANQMKAFSYTNTPMGIFLEEMGIEQERIASSFDNYLVNASKKWK